jgi:histidine triad (HIT) family protein
LEKEDSIFHKIIRREVPADIIYEDEECIAIKDIAPASPVHCLVIPKKTLPSLNDLTREDRLIAGHLLFVCSHLAKELGVDEDGYRVVINTGRDGQQTVFQLHLHLLAGRSQKWPPG